jgi:hypothetical protein
MDKVIYRPSVESMERMKSRYPGLEGFSYEIWNHDFFIDGLLGFDMKQQRPYKGGGIVSFVKSLAKLVDEQGKGTLHGHMTLTLYGHNRFRLRMQQPGASEGLSAFIDFIICSSIPWNTIGYDVASTCKDCGCKLDMDEVQRQEAQKVKDKKILDDPQILRCDKCDTLVGAKTKCREAVIAQMQTLGMNLDLTDASSVADLRWNFMTKQYVYGTPQWHAVWCFLMTTNLATHKHVIRACTKSKKAQDTGICRAHKPEPATTPYTRVDMVVGTDCLHISEKCRCGTTLVRVEGDPNKPLPAKQFYVQRCEWCGPRLGRGLPVPREDESTTEQKESGTEAPNKTKSANVLGIGVFVGVCCPLCRLN